MMVMVMEILESNTFPRKILLGMMMDGEMHHHMKVQL
jgi:hypothetical protein